jgi:hypothetical protein
MQTIPEVQGRRASRFEVKAAESSSALVSRIRVTVNPRHWNMVFWDKGGARNGELTVAADDGPAMVDRFIPEDQQTINVEF